MLGGRGLVSDGQADILSEGELIFQTPVQPIGSEQGTPINVKTFS